MAVGISAASAVTFHITNSQKACTMLKPRAPNIRWYSA